MQHQHPHLNIAIRAATEAGKVIIRSLNKLDSIKIESKGRNDFVSEVDYKAEMTIVQILQNAYPEHNILGEENGEIIGKNSTGEYQWIIDPLDGTTNYLHGFPAYAVSIALVKNNIVQHGVIYDPLKDELFTASIGDGAYLNQTRLRLSGCTQMKKALIGTGFPFKNIEDLDDYLIMFKQVFNQSSGIRRAGSAALDLAYLAAGRLDGFWEMKLQPWDIAAGVLLVSEAGGVVTDFENGDGFLQSGNIVAGSLDIHQTLLDLIKN